MSHVLWRGLAAAAALFVSVAPVAQAQESLTITGKVTGDGNMPVEGANIVIGALQISVGTNAAGQYTIVIPGARLKSQAATLRARAIGYAPEAKDIILKAGRQTYDFQLRKDASRLQQVVVTGVTGATEQTKTPFTVSQVNAADMPVPGLSPLTQLQGKVPGANIVSFSGRPGSNPAVLLRGPTSVNAAGRGQDPLYIVDGVILNGPLPDINPQDIESVEVVKGAAAASLYGSRAGQGVIQITTKSGKSSGDNSLKFQLRAEYGQGDLPRKIQIAQRHGMYLDATGQRLCVNQSGANAVAGMLIQCLSTVDYGTEQRRVNNVPGDVSATPVGFPLDPGASSTGAALRGRFQNNLWPGRTYDAVSQFGAPQPFGLYNLDATGRFGRTSFFASVNFQDAGGAVAFLKGNQRIGYRLNLDHRASNALTFQLNTMYARSESDGASFENGGGGLTGTAPFFRLTRVPAIVNLNQRDTLGRLYIRPNLQGGGLQNENPLYALENNKRNDITDRLLASGTVRWVPNSWADIDANFSTDLTRQNGFEFNDLGFRTTGLSLDIPRGGVFYYGQTSQSLNGSVNATARQTLGPLSVRYNARYLYEQQNFDGQNVSGFFMSVQGVPQIANTQSDQRNGSSSQSQVRQIGMFAGMNLELSDRYILDMLVRRDGTSLFGRDNRWQTYGRVSGAYRVTQEKFLRNNKFITELKLRGSYGTAGNRPNFSAQYETFSINASGLPVFGVLGNSLLGPEVVTEQDYGFDAELFSRFGVRVSKYKSDSRDQILLVASPAGAGFSSQWLNAGTLSNDGFEAQVTLPVIQKRDISYNVTLNYDYVRSTVTQLNVPAFNFAAPGVTNATGVFRIEQGARYGELRGRAFVTRCDQLPTAWNVAGTPVNFQALCGPGRPFQKNSDGMIVWVGGETGNLTGNGRNLGDGVRNNLWNAILPANQAPWGVQAAWGHPLRVRTETGGADANQNLGSVLPNFRWSTSHNFTWKRLTAFALADATVGRVVMNQGLHWSLLDFNWGGSDQISKSVTDAKPMSYYYRAGPPENGAGLGGLYDVLAPNSYNTEDASFVRIREVVLSYRVGKLARIGGDWQVALIGRNLFTFTDYRGFDPEVGANGGTTGSGVLNAFDNFTFPNPRTITFSLSTSF
jgi:TonB-linked SusC/RagA family outer membrane protein